MRRHCGWLLAGALILSGCEEAERAHDERREQQLARDNALYYRERCVEAIERRRVVPGPDEGKLPGALDGQNCQSPQLGNYALSAEQGRAVRSSVIRLDPTRLSAYTVEVVGQDGKTYSYRERGLAEAAEEQAGTFDDSSAGGTLPTPAEPADGDPQQPGVSEGTE